MHSFGHGPSGLTLTRILSMSDLITNDATFLSVLDFKERYKLRPTFLSFMGIISAENQC